MLGRFGMVSLAVLALAAGACSSSKTLTTAITTDTTEATTPISVTTPSTTVAIDVTIAVSTTEAVARGWQPLAPEQITGQAGFPCCASNYYGVPSPAFPASGESLADGNYAVSAQWEDDPTQPLQITLRRFDQCSVLPEGACELSDEYPPDELGIDLSSSVAVTVPLDDQLRVILLGFAGFSEDTGVLDGGAIGSGTELAALAGAVEDAYATLLAAPLTAGQDGQSIIDDLWANPKGGFGPAVDGSTSSLSFTFRDAPPLLFQAPFRSTDAGIPVAGRGTDVLGMPSLDVKDDRFTLYVYAGWYS